MASLRVEGWNHIQAWYEAVRGLQESLIRCGLDAAKIVAPAGSDQKLFGDFKRADGTMQSTFKGWPLYYFAGDKAKGETKGNGVKEVWYIINPEVMKACD